MKQTKRRESLNPGKKDFCLAIYPKTLQLILKSSNTTRRPNMRSQQAAVLIIEADFNGVVEKSFDVSRAQKIFEICHSLQGCRTRMIDTPTGIAILANIEDDPDLLEAIRGCDPHSFLSIYVHLHPEFRFRFIEVDRIIYHLQNPTLDELVLSYQGSVQYTNGPDYAFGYDGMLWEVVNG